ncbi:MAG: hypothetical protein ACR2G3_00935 [Solirubrobacterales bacterium]
MLATFLVLTGGTAYALEGQNTVNSGDIIDDQVRSIDVRDDTLVGGGLARQDLAPDSVAASEVVNGSLTGTDVLNDSLTGADVSGLTGSDINESTLATLDGHDSYDANCDPGNETFIVCDEIAFTLGRPMEVSVSWAYAMGTDGDVNANGECRTTLDGNAKSDTIWLSSEDDSDFSHGGVPVVDVMNLTAGNHTVGFECREHQPDGKDLVIRDLTISAVELGFD